jgi:hypothetical protein
MNQQTIAGMISTGLTLGALVYQAGKHSETIESLGIRVAQAEKRARDHDSVIFDIHGKVCSIEKDIKHLLKSIDGSS